MSHEKIDEVTQLFEVLYAIDQRLLREAEELAANQNENDHWKYKNTRQRDEWI